MATLTKTHTANRGTSTYKGDGITINVPKSAGDHPATIEVTGLTPTAKAAKAKMTPEARKAKAAEEKARLAGLTPEQKKADKAEKLRKRLAALEGAAA